MGLKIPQTSARQEVRAAMVVAALAISASACGPAPSLTELELDAERSLYALIETRDGVAIFPPLGPGPASAAQPFDSTLLAGLSVVLEAVDASGQAQVVGTFDRTSSPRLSLLELREVYFVDVPALQYFTDPTRTYRFRILHDGVELGRSELSDRVFAILGKFPGLRIGVKVRVELPPRATCSDGLQNQGEDSVDCGGPCAACSGESCRALHDAGALTSGLYVIDADGAGPLTPFEVYCDMTTEGGGWTLVARHRDGLTPSWTTGTVDLTSFSVMTDERWVALRAGMVDGMMFRDEYDQVSRVSLTTLLGANCQPLAMTLMPAGYGLIYHWETGSCNIEGGDYSLVVLGAQPDWGASVYHMGVRFDLWPYPRSYSYRYQDELSYFIR